MALFLFCSSKPNHHTQPFGVLHRFPFRVQTSKAEVYRRFYMTSEDEDDDDFIAGPESCNVLGTTLCACCENVRGTGIGTGFYRNGYCSTGPDDLGRHTVCVQVTDEFLSFSRSVGNDLSTTIPEYMFPGLREGDIWCLCAERWVQAYKAGMAPKLYLKSTHEKTLNFVPMEVLRDYALDLEEADRMVDELNEQRTKLDKLLP